MAQLILKLGDDSLGVGANESGIVTINNPNIISSGTNGVGIGTRDNDGIINILLVKLMQNYMLSKCLMVIINK